MVPLARHLADTGHAVAFATASGFCRAVDQAGFDSFPAGLGHGPASEQASRQARGGDQGHQEAARAQPEATPAWVFGANLFAGVAGPAKVAQLVEVIDTWRPDIVVHGAMDYGAPIAATVAGVPYVDHSFGPLSSAEFLDLAGDLVAPVWRQWGAEPEELGGMFRYLYLDICPPSFQAPHAAAVPVAHPLRPVPFESDSGEALPAWARALPPVPTVYVTLGTVANHTPGVFECVLAGLREEAINLIVTTGNNRDPAGLGPQPDNVHIERFLSHPAVLPLCDLVIAHGGVGTTVGALAAGLPVLLLPQGVPNQSWMAERAVSLGLGLQLPSGEVTPDSVREAARTLLLDASYRRAAEMLRDEIARMPGPAKVVALLERVTLDRQPIPTLTGL